MRKFGAILIVLLLLCGAGYYFYRRPAWQPQWMRSLFATSGDAAATARVKTALTLSKRVSPFHIGVETTNGVVTLSGEVPSEDLKSLAGEIARDTSGVNEVNNQIGVDVAAQPSSESSRVDDLEIRASILEAFGRSAELGGKNVQVRVEDRKVTLDGTVETPVQRNGAEQTARAIDGVAAVINNLIVSNSQAATEPPASGTPLPDVNAELAKRVRFELYETGAFEISSMNVKADEGTVTISGTVRTRAEQVLAPLVAQSTPGVKKVVNQLQVSSSTPRR